ncbi:hypothetical protein [Brevibacterium paucivorans]|uniref:Lipoprotein n=1 Tax=Brevibacterium paucivorans TaxID=170994 RepID=A0A2N6VPH1_9MICO|nr:hypothetical protein [Brevibacterium paucivorans]PMD05989.1 hypothetical protein CJ199_00860 [Brevibacterium paucivorans]
MKPFRVCLAAVAIVALAGCGSTQTAGGESTVENQNQSAEKSDVAPSEAAPTKTSDIVDSKSTKKESSKPKTPFAEHFGGPKANKADFHETLLYSNKEAYYFQTPSEVHYCMITAEEVGCMSHRFPADVPMVRAADGSNEKQPANAVRLPAGKKGEMFAVSDVAYYNHQGSTTVLEYGEVLAVKGFECTTNKDLGVICRKDSHGIQFSSKKHKEW